MKFLAALLLTILLCTAYVKAKDEQCEKNGGRCVVSSSAKGGSCKRLPYQCAPDTLCCKETRTINQGLKRKCRKTPHKCKKEGGACVSAKDGTCETVTVDKLCKGSSCTCCLGDKPSCTILPPCIFKGGFCINKYKPNHCTGGTFDAKLCRGKKCACCISNTTRNCQCGQANEAKIVGGEEVSPKNKYPWMVGIALPKILDTLWCGGTLINDRYVITAAHCLFGKNEKPLKSKAIKISLAEHNQASAVDDVQGVTRMVDIETYTVHEFYDPETSDEDIAFIKLKEPLDLSSNKEIKPVCLPTNKFETYEGADGIIAGWGITDSYDYYTSDILMEVTVPILSKAECDNSSLPGPITDNMLCAGFKKGGKDSCQGDSGGPLVVKEGSTYTLVGVVSWGVGCADPNSPGVYTRVTQYLDWIIENTRDANYCS